MLTIGKIPFANLYPIFFRLAQTCDPSEFRFTEGVPSEINRLLREGSVHISPSSSIEYLRRPEDYTLIPGHSISSFGPIRSILLFSRVPVEDLGDREILASSQSETSTALLRIILGRFYGLPTTVRVTSLDLSAGLSRAPAHMLIGDDALSWARLVNEPGADVQGVRAGNAGGAPRIHVYDLGEVWYRKTGLPFVFALWIARKECCAVEEFARFVEHLDEAKAFAIDNFRAIAGDSPYRKGIGIDGLVSYWENMSYDLEDAHREGLALFRRYLEEERIL